MIYRRVSTTIRKKQLSSDILNRKNGFTLLEIIIVVILLIAIAAFALPKLLSVTKQAKSREGTVILSAVFIEQKNYHTDNDSYATNLSQLGMTIPTLKHFKNLTIRDGSMSAACNTKFYSFIASLQEIDSEFTLYLSDTGEILCGPCGSSTCQRYGFQEWE